MTDTSAIPLSDWAAALLAVDPALGGIALSARASPARETWVEGFLTLTGRAHRRVGPGAGDDRLFGGVDLTATLRAGQPVMDPGLLAWIDTGTLVLPMAERLSLGRAARLAQAWDAGAAFAVLALDEASEDDDQIPPALLDRLAFRISLTPQAQRDALPPHTAFVPADITAAQQRLARVEVPSGVIEALTGTAAALGIPSLRAPALALRTARAAAALMGTPQVTRDTAELAAALVLAPRAIQLPPAEEEDTAPQPNDPPPPKDPSDPTSDPGETTQIPEDLLLEAARAAIPADLLAQLAARAALTRSGAAPAGAGEDQKGAARGRPAGTRPGDPRSGARLDLVATLRTAAPWQPLRRKMLGHDPGRLLITPEDFRLRRFKQKAEKVVIFVVDASGSAALARLAETKGAIELMLAEAYVRREQVALIAFRGAQAEVLLPPTRSLVQAKRRLSGLPGGGGTPLAAGLEAALALADQIGRRGQSAHLAVLTDGRANIARDGAQGRTQALADAQTVARVVRASGIASLVIDTGNRPAPTARTLAEDLGAAYLALPRADAQVLAGTLQAALDPQAA